MMNEYVTAAANYLIDNGITLYCDKYNFSICVPEERVVVATLWANSRSLTGSHPLTMVRLDRYFGRDGDDLFQEVVFDLFEPDSLDALLEHVIMSINGYKLWLKYKLDSGVDTTPPTPESYFGYKYEC